MKNKPMTVEIPSQYLSGNNTIVILVVSSEGEIQAVDFTGVNENLSPKAEEFKKYIISVARTFNRPIVIADKWYEKVAKTFTHLPFDYIDTAFEWMQKKQTASGKFKFEQTYPMTASRLNKFLASASKGNWYNSQNKLT